MYCFLVIYTITIKVRSLLLLLQMGKLRLKENSMPQASEFITGGRFKLEIY